MSGIGKNIIMDGVSYNCKTLGELLDCFRVKLSYFMNEKKRLFPLCSNDLCTFNEYLIMDYYENPLHVFCGKNEGCYIEYILDIRHQLIYYLYHAKEMLVVKEYDLNGELLNIVESVDNLSIDDAIGEYFIRDYLCYNVGELLDAFNLDFELSDKLKAHVLVEKENQKCDYCCGHRIMFSDYYVKSIKDRKLYVFESMFDNDTIVFDSEAPVYYIDPERSFLYVETRGMVGICILQFNMDNEIIKDAHSWIVDMEMFLELTD